MENKEVTYYDMILYYLILISQLKQHPLSDIEQMLNKIYQLVTEGESGGKKSGSISLLSSDLAGPVLIELAEIALQCSLYELTKQCLESVNERDKVISIVSLYYLLLIILGTRIVSEETSTEYSIDYNKFKLYPN